MDFSEVEKLKQEDIMELYDDIMEFGDDTRLTGCCCGSGSTRGYFDRDGCRAWCRGRGSSCTGWGSYGHFFNYCPFGC